MSGEKEGISMNLLLAVAHGSSSFVAKEVRQFVDNFVAHNFETEGTNKIGRAHQRAPKLTIRFLSYLLS